MSTVEVEEVGQPGQSELLNTGQAAEYLGVTVGTLEVWRCSKRYQIPYYKTGRLVEYRRSDLDSWLESRRVAPVAVEA
jgi:excisionase family DNA binding protein